MVAPFVTANNFLRKFPNWRFSILPVTLAPIEGIREQNNSRGSLRHAKGIREKFDPPLARLHPSPWGFERESVRLIQQQNRGRGGGGRWNLRAPERIYAGSATYLSTYIFTRFSASIWRTRLVPLEFCASTLLLPLFLEWPITDNGDFRGSSGG